MSGLLSIVKIANEIYQAHEGASYTVWSKKDKLDNLQKKYSKSQEDERALALEILQQVTTDSIKGRHLKAIYDVLAEAAIVRLQDETLTREEQRIFLAAQKANDAKTILDDAIQTNYLQQFTHVANNQSLIDAATQFIHQHPKLVVSEKNYNERKNAAAKEFALANKIAISQEAYLQRKQFNELKDVQKETNNLMQRANFQVDLSQAVIKKLEKNVKQSSQESLQSDAKLQNATQSINALLQDLQNTKNNHRLAEKTANKNMNSLQQVEKELFNKKKEVTQLQERLATSNSKIQDTNKLQQNLRAESSKKDSQIKALEIQVKNLSEQLEKQHSSETDTAVLEAKYSAALKEINHLKSLPGSLRVKMDKAPNVSVAKNNATLYANTNRQSVYNEVQESKLQYRKKQ